MPQKHEIADGQCRNGSRAGQSNGDVDESRGHTIESKGPADPLNVSHRVSVGHGDGVG